MADNKEVFKIDLDAKEFIDTANKAKDSVKAIGEQESISNLVDTFKSIAPLLGVVATAAYTVKSALDLTLEAESIRKVSSQFEILAKNAGISSTELKDGLEKVSDGLVDTDDLLKSANKAIVTLGSSASKLPEIFEQAKNITKVFGGDLITNFETINQAVATGQTRMLRQVGLIVDADEANRKYANSLGITVNALSDNERKQALLNAVLEKSKETYSGIKTDNESASISVQKLSTSIKELKDTVILALDKVIGPTIRSTLVDLNALAKAFARNLQATFGEGIEQTDAQISKVEGKIRVLKERLERLEGPREGILDKLIGPPETAKKRVRELLEEQETLLATLKQKRDQALEEAKAQGPTEVKTEVDEMANARRLQIASKFEESLDQLRLKRVASEEQVATTIEQVNALSQEKIQALLELQNAQFRELDAQRALQEIATDEEVNARKVELAANTAAQITAIQNQTTDRQIQALDRLAAFNKNNAQGMTAALTAFSKKAEADFNNMAKRGQFVGTSLTNSLGSAFLAIGDGSKTAGEAMKDAFLGTIADVAAAEGAKLLAMGLWPPNPVALGAGGALMALSGFLRSQTKQAGATPPTATVAAPSVGVTPQPGLEDAATGPKVPEAQKRVTVNIMGHYFETPETRRMLTDMIRQESDATQFTIQQIGQGA